MAPKKLTDCPENLREAIDWLIQVRHGSGNGLEHLAKAVKKLIEEAIKKAYTTNVNALLKLLDSAKSYTCCKDKVGEIDKLKDLKNIENNLLHDLKTKSGNIKKCYKRHIDDSQQKAYLDIVSRLDQLEKLKESLTGLTDEKQCKNLLENLCDGLETFLGFNPASKGYDGTGIVYSDLDRLCDGVMGFLHGVLKNVKHNTNLSLYAKTLESTVYDLHTKLNKGRASLHDAIDTAKNGIAAWLNDVRSRSEAVKQPIETLLDETHLPMILKGIEAMKTRKYNEEALMNWIAEVNQLPKYSKKSFDALSNVDPKLRTLISQHVEVIKRLVESYQQSAVTDVYGLTAVCSRVDGEFQALDFSVNDGINNNTKGLKKHLSDEISKVINKVDAERKGKLFHSIQDSKNTLLTANVRAKQYMESFANEKQKQFVQKFSEINMLLKQVTKKDSGVPLNRSPLYREVDALTGMITETENQLQLAARDIGDTIYGVASAADEALTQLDQKVQLGLGRVKTQIEVEIEKVIEALKSGIRSASTYTSDGEHDRAGVPGAQEIIHKFQTVLHNDAPLLYQWGRAAQMSNFRSVLANLDKNTGGVNTDNFKAFKAFLAELMVGVVSPGLDGQPTNFCGALFKDLKKKIQDAITAVKKTDKFGLVFLEYKQWVKTSGDANNSLKAKIDAIKDSMKDYFNEGIKPNGSTFNLTDSSHFGTYHTQKQAAIEAIQKARAQVETLEELPVKVSETRSSVEQLIDAINRELVQLNHSAERALEIVTNAETQLNDLLDEINRSLVQFQNAFVKHIDEFYTLYLAASKKSSTIIKKESLNQFAVSMETRIQKLQAVVKEKHAEIAKLVVQDSNSGVKGLVKAMYGGDIPASLARPGVQYADPHNKLTKLKAELDKNFRSTLHDASKSARDYVDLILSYVGNDIKKLFNIQPYNPNDNAHYNKLKAVFDKFGNLFKHLTHYDSEFVDNFAEFTKTLGELNPFTFSDVPIPCLEIVKKGLTELARELDGASVNTYSGSKVTWTKDLKSNTITADGISCGKICLTLINTLYEDLDELRRQCNGVWYDKRISLRTNNGSNDLGKWFKKRGFTVSKNEHGHEGELRNELKMKGLFVCGKLFERQKIFNKAETQYGTLYNLSAHLATYYNICHLSTLSLSKHPSSVFEMLVWLTGVWYNPALNRISGEIADLRNNAKYKNDDVFKPLFDKYFSLKMLPICQNAYSLLTTITGYGHSGTHYGCEYFDNSIQLYYPTSGADCLHMFVDVLRRLFPPLRFLESRCSISAQYYGWADCHYGRGVDASSWQCEKHPADNEIYCQPVSPLMSYLNDCLPGHLPHRLESIGCKSECKTCPTSKLGMPCLTPLGFRGLSGSSRTGKDLCDIIRKFISNPHLVSLLSLIPRPPSTLPEHFGFALSLAKSLSTPQSNVDGIKSFAEVFGNSIIDRSIKLNKPAELRTSIAEAYGSSFATHSDCSDPHLMSLTTFRLCKGKDGVIDCAPYLSSLFSDSYQYLANKHSDLYLSWAVYLPWQLWGFLNSLLGAFCNIFCRDWQCNECLHDDKCKSGQHGYLDGSCKCHSIVSCKGVSPTLYIYGFTVGGAVELSGGLERRTCSDFQRHFMNVLQSEYFSTLFQECDNFLWKIREPFSYLVLALWLLSLLYLLHIMVIRLDLLHIKSHLHTPSSHRIAAQSLLAAARAGKLSKISYLQA